MTVSDSTVSTYINDPTQLLVEQIRGMIEGRPDWRGDSEVLAAYREFDDVCRSEPAIVAFMRHTCSNKNGFLTVEQMQLIMLATLMRSSSSYGTIPELVVQLNLASDYELAAKINDNAVHEAGTSSIASHPQLLLDSFSVIGRAIRSYLEGMGKLASFPILTQASHALVRHIFSLRRAIGDDTYSDLVGIRRYLDDEQVFLPAFTDRDLLTALHYCSLCDERIAIYHSSVLAHILGMDDRGFTRACPSIRRDPTDRGWLALQAFEFCTREASSADEGGTISYVGAYGLFTKAFLGYLNFTDRVRATKWWLVHSDEEVGKELGWGTTAELGHARDARELVARTFEGLDGRNLARAIRGATSMSRHRLTHWRIVTDRLIALGRQDDAIRIPFRIAGFRSALMQHTETVKSELNFDRRENALTITLDDGRKVRLAGMKDDDLSSLFEALGLTPELLDALKRGKAIGQLSARIDYRPCDEGPP